MADNISAVIIADSFNPDYNVRLTTFELEYPRFILAEMNTHRVFSRNSASSRAIPIDRVIDLVNNSPAMPVHFGKNIPGMKAMEEIDNRDGAIALWLAARDSAVSHARVMQSMGLHKQVVNRILEPFQMIKTVVSGTCFKNFFWLRNHEDAQPEIRELAKKMFAAYLASKPENLYENEWHVPYVKTEVIRGKQSRRIYLDEAGNEITANKARMISASCCAQVSYRKNDPSLEKAEVIYDRLINSKPVHASPVEHIAMPMLCSKLKVYPPGCITHVDAEGIPWSNNFHGWIQFRALIDQNVVKY